MKGWFSDLSRRQVSLFLLGGWTVLNLWQAWQSELLHDEAYYWFFSLHPAWGYAEHAPMISWMIWLGRHLLGGEIGVRLLTVLMSTGTLWLVFQCTDRQQPRLFWMIALSMIIVHFGGFIAAPDSPLIFFTALYLYLFKRYLEAETLLNTLLLGLAVVGLVYSKYHGLMVLFFCLLGHPVLLKKGSFWALAIGCTLLYLPHLSFLYGENFGTFTYHLVDRIATPWEPHFFYDFFLNQLLIAGPFIGFWIFIAVWKIKPADPFERCLKFIIWGVLGFLFLLSFQTHIEANWAATAYLPILILTYRYMKDWEKGQLWLRRLLIPSLVIIGVFRLYLVVDFLPFVATIRNEFHQYDTWAEEVAEIAGDRPVVFHNSYTYPSKYRFYAGKEGHGFNDMNYRRTQYDLLPIEESLQGKEVVYMRAGQLDWADTLHAAVGRDFLYRIVPNFRSYNRLMLEITSEVPDKMPAGDSLAVEMKLVNGYETPVDLLANPQLGLTRAVYWTQRGSFSQLQFSHKFITPRILTDTMNLDWKIAMPTTPGTYEFIVTLRQEWVSPGIKARQYQIEIE
ncbi:MAG: glycosyltransferase family 39 protein [Bacteroidota bacterium]